MQSFKLSTSSTAVSALRLQLLNRPCANHQFKRATPLTLSLPSRAFSTSIPFISTRQASTSPTRVDAQSSDLTWNEFLHLRKIRRRYNLGSSISGSVVTGLTGAGLLAQQNLEALSQQFFSLDPMVIMGIWTMGFLGLGWLLGPLVGTTLFRLVHRKSGLQMVTKERDFFERIKKHRVDPTSSSMQNPVPDYYGEKITSVAGYRQWLKDQRAFNRKRQSFV